MSADRARLAAVALAAVLASTASLAASRSAHAGDGGMSGPPANGGMSGLPALRLHLPDRVRIPAGEFAMGASSAAQARALQLCRSESRADHCKAEDFAVEGPVHRVWLPAYSIDRREVAAADYARCQAALACAPPHVVSESGYLPVTGVTASEAADYCAFVGGRLPTEAEWERAAGGDGRLFPWGQQWNDSLARHGGRLSRDLLGRVREPEVRGSGPLAVDSLSDGDSPYGVRNLAGNVWEWTADVYGAEYYRHSPTVEPKGPATGKLRVVRGGSFLSMPHQLRSTARHALAAQAYAIDVGFRCAYDSAPSPPVRDPENARGSS